MDRRYRVISAVRSRLMGEVSTLSGRRLALSRGKPLPDLPVLRRVNDLLLGGAVPGVSTTDVTVPGAVGPLDARLHRPADTAGPTPVLLYLHGGGWVVGAPDLYDWTCQALADETGAVVVAPAYRKAPEHRAPAALDDCIAVADWLTRPQGLRRVGADGPLIVAGDSAGGSLATLVAIAARDAGVSGVAGQVLIYPSTDLTNSSPSSIDKVDEPLLPRRHMLDYTELYLGDAVKPTDPRVSPLHVADLSGLPPALVILAEHDLLRDEGAAYAARLEAAGVSTRLTEYVDVPHGFMALPTVSPLARQAVAEVGAFVRSVLAT